MKKDDLDDKSNASSKASFANDNNPYYPYDETLFGHDPIATLDLARSISCFSSIIAKILLSVHTDKIACLQHYCWHIPTKLLKTLFTSLL